MSPELGRPAGPSCGRGIARLRRGSPDPAAGRFEAAINRLQFRLRAFLPLTAVVHRKTPDSWIARHNRLGCFLIAAVLLLLVVALAYIGFHGDPIDDLQSDIPALG